MGWGRRVRRLGHGIEGWRGGESRVERGLGGYGFYGLCWISGGEEMAPCEGQGVVIHLCPYMKCADSEAFERVVLLNGVSASLKGCVRISSREGGCWEVKISSGW